MITGGKAGPRARPSAEPAVHLSSPRRCQTLTSTEHSRGQSRPPRCSRRLPCVAALPSARPPRACGRSTPRSRSRLLRLTRPRRRRCSTPGAGATGEDRPRLGRRIAPNTTRARRASTPADPRRPELRLGGYDDLIRRGRARAAARSSASTTRRAWAERAGGRLAGTNNPTRAELAAFFTAIARRYSGTYPGLPRVRHVRGLERAERELLLHAPEGRQRPPVVARPLPRDGERLRGRRARRPRRQPRGRGRRCSRSSSTAPPRTAIAPLRFMREVLCMSKKLRPKPNCGPPVAVRRVEPPPLHLGRPDPSDAATPTASRSAGCSAWAKLLRAAVAARAGPVARPGAVLGHGVGLGQQSARPAGRAARRCTRAGCPRRSTGCGARASASRPGSSCATAAGRTRGPVRPLRCAARRASRATGRSSRCRRSGSRSWPCAGTARCASGAGSRPARPRPGGGREARRGQWVRVGSAKVNPAGALLSPSAARQARPLPGADPGRRGVARILAEGPAGLPRQPPVG